MFRVVTTIFLICIVFKTEARAGDTAARMRGDFVIGGLFSVHKPPRGDQGALECGAIREIYGIQRIETALRVLDEINNSTEVLRGVTLGLEARDSCWSAPVALQQSLELIRDAMIAPASKPDIQHNVSSSCLMPDTQVSLKAPLIGVVGPGSSSVALQVQNLLQLFSIPQIGYSATSRDLSDKTRYSTFLRVVPSDYYQAQLLVDLVRYFNWTYVSIVNTDADLSTDPSRGPVNHFLEAKHSVTVKMDATLRSNSVSMKKQRRKLQADIEACREIIKEMFSIEHFEYAWPFYKAIDADRLGLQDYFKVIKKPMDLEGIKLKLDNHHYNTADEFVADMRQIFTNCYKFFTPGHHYVTLGSGIAGRVRNKKC